MKSSWGLAPWEARRDLWRCRLSSCWSQELKGSCREVDAWPHGQSAGVLLGKVQPSYRNGPQNFEIPVYMTFPRTATGMEQVWACETSHVCCGKPWWSSESPHWTQQPDTEISIVGVYFWFVQRVAVPFFFLLGTRNSLTYCDITGVPQTEHSQKLDFREIYNILENLDCTCLDV